MDLNDNDLKLIFLQLEALQTKTEKEIRFFFPRNT